MTDAESSEDLPANSLLMLALRNESTQAMERLLAIYRPFLTNVAGQFIPEGLQGRMDRSDLVQETLIRGVTQRDQFRGTTENEFAAWLRQILQNVAIDWIRYHTAEKRDIRRTADEVEDLVSQENSPSQNVRQEEEFQQITTAMMQLSKDQRLVIELRSEGLGFKEIGWRTGRSEDAARMQWGRALARLLKILESHGRTR